MALAPRIENHSAAVGRPGRFQFLRRVERKTRFETPRHIIYPDIPRGASRHTDGSSLRIRRQFKIAVTSRSGSVSDDAYLLAGAVEPRELGTGCCRSRLIYQYAIFRHREDANRRSALRLNLLGNGKRVAREFEALRVKRLGHERGLAHKKQMALGIEEIS